MISMQNWPHGLAHEGTQNKRLEAQGVVLWCFEFAEQTHYLGVLPDRRVVSSSAATCSAEGRFSARESVVEHVRVALGKCRTPAHVIFFSKLDEKRD